jgi:hypothetical protein
MDAPGATNAAGQADGGGEASARDLETANAPPLCGAPLPWDCSIFDAVKKDAHDTAPAAASTEVAGEGSAILPPFVGAASTASLLQRDHAFGTGFEPGWEIAGAVVLLAGIGGAVIVRRAAAARKKRPTALDCAE